MSHIYLKAGPGAGGAARGGFDPAGQASRRLAFGPVGEKTRGIEGARTACGPGSVPAR
ncbi:hypothetical protein SUDANB146_05174 [Streptomyces sp. enrichment culture]